MEDSEIEVMSEIHLGCPSATTGPFLSRFTFAFPIGTSLPLSLPPSSMIEEAKDGPGPSNDQCIGLDKDGDLVLPRRTSRSPHSFTVTIQHCITSTLRDVGLQVWKAELVLSDFVLHKMCTSSELNATVCLELGAGTGLLGILLARVAKAVFITGSASSKISSSHTFFFSNWWWSEAFLFPSSFSCTIDYGDEILGNCAQNVEMNSSLFNPHAVVSVRELNWMSDWRIEDNHGESRAPKKYCWSSQDFEQVKSASFIFAADVIYSDDLTNALFSMLKRVMSFGCEKVLYLALEKRYNFSLDDLNIVANGYACFRSFIKEDGLCEKEDKSFVGKRINVTEIPQYLKGYDRGEDVELWEIKYVH